MFRVCCFSKLAPPPRSFNLSSPLSFWTGFTSFPAILCVLTTLETLLLEMPQSAYLPGNSSSGLSLNSIFSRMLSQNPFLICHPHCSTAAVVVVMLCHNLWFLGFFRDRLCFHVHFSCITHNWSLNIC